MAGIHCPEHPNGILIEDYRAGDMICRECGLVVGDRVIDVTSEWRTFANDSDAKDRSRVGDVQNKLLSGSDLSTRIGVEMKPGSNWEELASSTKNLKTLRRAAGSPREFGDVLWSSTEVP